MEKIAFLGGTCNGSVWREELISKLDSDSKFFNPVVDDWNQEAYELELKYRETSSVLVYWINSSMTGVYSIAEAVDDSHLNPDRVVFGFDENGFDEDQIKSLKKTSDMISKNGGRVVSSLEELSIIINGECK